ncbi:hypothetical protein CVT26_011720 [Gymnopilus dilepis]|uniref:Uncharacterized protein n=1 Tax=Gymnopilus dilepis TaxID=231916 RepID=A0A409YGW4_9AGAR|nr:hypothetical protein CVT26_011720 [Gymnopilus dilepis]
MPLYLKRQAVMVFCRPSATLASKCELTVGYVPRCQFAATSLAPKQTGEVVFNLPMPALYIPLSSYLLANSRETGNTTTALPRALIVPD